LNIFEIVSNAGNHPWYTFTFNSLLSILAWEVAYIILFLLLINIQML